MLVAPRQARRHKSLVVIAKYMPMIVSMHMHVSGKCGCLHVLVLAQYCQRLRTTTLSYGFALMCANRSVHACERRSSVRNVMLA